MECFEGPGPHQAMYQSPRILCTTWLNFWMDAPAVAEADSNKALRLMGGPGDPTDATALRSNHSTKNDGSLMGKMAETIH